MDMSNKSVSKLTEEMGLHDLRDREWFIQGSCALTGEGIYEGFDVGLEMSGSPTAFSGMLELMINGGHIAMLAIMPLGSGIDWDMVVFKGLTIKGVYGREIFETWYKGSMMVQSGLPLEKIITHRFSYKEFQQGFDVMRSGQSGKVILDWTS